MPVLVTGGAGFIGSQLVHRLAAGGASVRVLELPGACVEHLPASVEIIHGDIRNWRTAQRAVAGCDEIYHLAANPHLWTQRRGHFQQVNYHGTRNVINAALDAGVGRILHVSTESILTRSHQTAPIAEEQGVTMQDVVGPYCRSKFLAERFALRLGQAGAPVLVANPTLPIGPGDRGRTPPTQMILDFCRDKRHEYVDADLNLIDARDIAEGIVRVMAAGKPGRRYLLGGENLSVRSVFAILARLTGLPEPHRRVPYPVALAAAYVSELISDVLTHRAPAASVTGVKLTRRRMHFDPRRSLAEIGLQPRPVAESLADALAWYRAMGWL